MVCRLQALLWRWTVLPSLDAGRTSHGQAPEQGVNLPPWMRAGGEDSAQSRLGLVECRLLAVDSAELDTHWMAQVGVSLALQMTHFPGYFRLFSAQDNLAILIHSLAFQFARK